MGLEIVYEDDSCRQGYVGPVHVVGWFDAPTLEQMQAYGVHSQALSRRLPLTGLMNLIVRGRARFDPAVRAEAKRLTERGVHRGGTAHVILAPGLAGSAVRAFMSTTVLLGRPKNPTKVFDEVRAGAGWLAERLDVDPQRLTAECEAFIGVD